MKFFLLILLVAVAAKAAAFYLQPKLKAEEGAGGTQPHLGRLVIALNYIRTSICGSSLLSNSRSVKALYCWRTRHLQARQFTVVGGSNVMSGGTRIVANQVTMHSNHNQNNLNLVIAIIVHNKVIFNSAGAMNPARRQISIGYRQTLGIIIMASTGNNRFLIGFTSYGTQWCTRRFAAGFARVTFFATWIHRQI